MNSRSRLDVTNFKNLPWGLVLGLAALALVRPVLRMSGVADGVSTAVVALGATTLITVVWVLVVGLSRTPEPVLTLVARTDVCRPGGGTQCRRLSAAGRRSAWAADQPDRTVRRLGV